MVAFSRQSEYLGNIVRGEPDLIYLVNQVRISQKALAIKADSFVSQIWNFLGSLNNSILLVACDPKPILESKITPYNQTAPLIPMDHVSSRKLADVGCRLDCTKALFSKELVCSEYARFRWVF